MGDQAASYKSLSTKLSETRCHEIKQIVLKKAFKIFATGIFKSSSQSEPDEVMSTSTLDGKICCILLCLLSAEI